MNLLPQPRFVKRGLGFYQLPNHTGLRFDGYVPKGAALNIAGRLNAMGDNNFTLAQ